MTTYTENYLETIFHMCFILPLSERMGWGLQKKITNNLQTKKQPSEKALKSYLWLDWSCVLFLSLLVVVLWIWFWKNHLFEIHNFPPPLWGFVFENISSFFHLCKDVDSMTQGRVECWGLFSTCLPRGRAWVIVQNWEIRKWKWCFPFLGSKQFLKYHYTIQIWV